MDSSQTEGYRIDLILESIADGVFAVDKDFKITVFNKAAEIISGWKAQDAIGRQCKEVMNNKLCDENCLIQQAMKKRGASAAETEIKTRDGRSINLLVNAAAVIDEKGDLIGGVESLKDITETKKLSELAEQQQKAILQLSTPVISIWGKILGVPLIGTLDSARTQQVMETLLQKIVDTGSRVVILDISGIPTVDTLVANHLIRTVRACRLLGAECIITGVSSMIAQTIVHLGVDLAGIVTRPSMSDGISMAYDILNLKVVSK